MSRPCGDRAEFCDHGDTDFGVFATRSSILSTRKRKFSQFFAAAAAPDTLPSHEFANPNAPKTNTGDLKPYDHSDLLQYVIIASDSYLCLDLASLPFFFYSDVEFNRGSSSIV